MEFVSYRCDECGKVKGESNLWFWGVKLPGRYVLAEWDAPLRDENALPLVKHFCGIGCATKAISRDMGGQA